ncbi:MAG: hypothetical protein QG674_132 [Patescibacteria group bacterium]|nr:hypothetical protein [Patescibacteria group bacterium]
MRETKISTMKKKSYVGVTGFMSPKEVIDTLKDIDFKKAHRLLMVGVLASSKTIQGISNKWPNRYPPLGEIKNIFQENENCLNLVHYNTKQPEGLLAQLVQITDEVGPVLHGFQLNIAWPDPKTLEKYHNLCPGKTIVLQIGGHAFEQVGNNPSKLSIKLNEYQEVIDYVLLDPSGGLGQPFDPDKAKQYLEKLTRYEYQFGLGVAGGLSPSTLHLLEPLLKDYPNISIDAEGRLRTQEDNLDVEITRDYIRKSLELFSVPT